MHRGPDAKGRKLGRTANAEWTEVVDVPFDGDSPALPKLSHRRKWHPMVERWWDQVRRMPHCVLWREVDWTYALETAYMKQAYWALSEEESPPTSMATEIRRREDNIGTTAEALRKLRIRYVADPNSLDDLVEEPEPEVVVTEVVEDGAGAASATVTPLSARRARLTRSA